MMDRSLPCALDGSLVVVYPGVRWRDNKGARYKVAGGLPEIPHFWRASLLPPSSYSFELLNSRSQTQINLCSLYHSLLFQQMDSFTLLSSFSSESPVLKQTSEIEETETCLPRDEAAAGGTGYTPSCVIA